MSRVKRGKTTHKKRERLLAQAKGFRWGRKSKYKAAKQALMKAWSYSYRDRKKRKGDFRRLWQVRINAAVREHGMSYGKFIAALKSAKIELDRKMLAELALREPYVFRAIVEKAKAQAR